MTVIQVSTSHDYTIIDGPGNHSKYKPEELFTQWALFKAKIMLAHNILPLKARLAAMGAGDGLCGPCGVPEDTRHLFQHCTRVADLWDGLYSRLAR
jgi:hypothetical protein